MTSAGYSAPTSLADALALLSANTSARVLAGGSSLLVAPSRGQLGSSLLVDLRQVPGLAGIEPAAGGLKIGAMTTLRALAASDAVRSLYPALASAATLNGDAQSRTRATIGGSIAGASGDSDIAAVLIALGATADVAGPSGSRSAAVESLTPGRDEVITSITVPAPAANSTVVYETQRHPATLTPLVGVAACVSPSGVSIGLVGATARAVRMAGVEQALKGAPVTDASARAAASSADQGLTVRGDLFGTSTYRSHLVRVLTARAVSRAAKAVKG